MIFNFATGTGSDLWIEVLKMLLPLAFMAIPLFWASSAYRKQKEIDRGEQLHAEKRKVYRDCLASFSNLRTENAIMKNVSDRDLNTEILGKALKSHALVILYGNDKVIEQALVCLNQFLGTGPDDNSRANIDKLSTVMKSDLVELA